jgi:hypothetical protein
VRVAVWTRTWKAAAVIGVLAAVVYLEFAFFGDQVTRNLDVLLARDARKEAAGAPRQPAPIPTLAPPAAGPVTQVELRPIDTCRPGGACNVLVQMGIRPQARPLLVTWHFDIFDRCRQSRERRPGGAVVVPPGRDRLIETSSVTMPPGPSLAVIPVTTDPVAVAGKPMRLPGDDKPC